VDAIDPAGWNRASRKVVARLVVVAGRWFRLWLGWNGWMVTSVLTPQIDGAEGDVRESSAAVDTFRQWCECARAMRMTSANRRRSHTHTVRQMPWLSARPRGRATYSKQYFYRRKTMGATYNVFFIICQKCCCNGQRFTRNLNGEHPPVKVHQKI